jgi:glutamyl/glutaminyl-tRNA synthetase
VNANHAHGHIGAPRTRGVRFAPSPTGRFHVGNLRTAWISNEWARHLGVPWVLRVEDIDTPRVLPGAREQQLADLALLGMTPEILLVQSQLRQRHWELFRRGILSGQIYPCDCSRKDVQAALSNLASAPHDSVAPVYSGACRPLSPLRDLHASETIAWRFRMPSPLGFEDFIIARSGGLLDKESLPSHDSFTPSYHWACAIDDFDGDYHLLVRSVDLKPAAILQRAIQHWLGAVEGALRIPAIFHTSLVVQNDGHRLEKRTPGITIGELPSGTRELLAIFERSFDRTHLQKELVAGDIAAEISDQLRLSDLRL